MSFKKVNGETVYGAEAIIAKALEPFKVALAVEGRFREGWEKLMKVDNLSVREYLLRCVKPEPPPAGVADKVAGEAADKELGLPFFVVQWMERMDSSTGSYDLAFSEVSHTSN